jgi:hypothetical protein
LLTIVIVGNVGGDKGRGDRKCVNGRVVLVISDRIMKGMTSDKAVPRATSKSMASL